MFGGNYPGQAYLGQTYGVRGIYFDNAVNSGYKAALSTYNFTHINTGSSQVLLVNVSLFATGSVSTITYNSINLTKVRSDAIGIYRNEIWSLDKPTYGSNTVTVNLSTSLTSIASSASYSNVDVNDKSIVANAGTTGSGVSTPTVSITTDAINQWVVDGISTSDASISPAAGQTQRDNNNGALGTGGVSDKGPVATASSVTMQWGAVGLTDSWAYGAVVLDPATTTLFSTALTASLAFVGITPVKSISRTLAGSLSFSGSLKRAIARSLLGSLSFVGSLSRQFSLVLVGSLSFVGNLSKTSKRAFSALAGFSGSLNRTVTILFSASITFSGSVVKMTIRSFSASLSLIGNLGIGGAIIRVLRLILGLPVPLSLSVTIPSPLSLNLLIPPPITLSLALPASLSLSVTVPAAIQSAVSIANPILIMLTVPPSLNLTVTTS